MHYFPVALPFLLIFAFLFIILLVLVEIGILQYAYHKIGIGPRHMFTLLVLSLLGSYINIPVAHLSPEYVYSGQQITFYGMTYVVPLVTEWPGTVIAVNFGGAVVPVILSIYLLVKNGLYVRGLLGVAIVTVIVNWMAHPVRGVGIAEPTFIPPLVTAGVALLLSPRSAPPLSYIAGSLGTLIGADILNLTRYRGSVPLLRRSGGRAPLTVSSSQGFCPC